MTTTGDDAPLTRSLHKGSAELLVLAGRWVERAGPALRLAAHLSIVGVLALGAASSADENAALAPPTTPARPVEERLHGEVVVDSYRWLEDRAAPETEAWIKEQNAYRDRVISSLPRVDGLATELAALFDYDDWGLPRRGGQRHFYSRRGANQPVSTIYVREGLSERALVDPARVAGEAVTVGLWGVSADGARLAYSVSERGEDEVRLEVVDVASGRLLATLPKRDYLGGDFAADGASLWYAANAESAPMLVRRDLASGEESRVAPPASAPGQRLRLQLSDDRRILLLRVSHGAGAQRSDLYFADATAATPRIAPLVVGVDAVFDPKFGGGQLFVRTNWRHPSYSVFRIDLADPRPEAWRELVVGSEAVITDFLPVAGALALAELRRVRPAVCVVDPATGARRDVPLPTVGTVGALGGEWARPDLFISFSSYAQPPTVLRVDVPTLEREVWASPGLGVALDGLETKLHWYPSKDGTEVPIFVTHAEGLRLDGSHPTFLVGYGGFGEVELPSYSTRAAYWALHGGVWAYAGVRGGGELGTAWHRAGIVERKQSSYDDFAAAAEWLVRQGYTRSERLAIGGGSNGGLMALAVAVERPELVRFVLAYSPLTDMLRYHRFLKAARWIPEYGSADDPAQFRALRAYSPYQNVRPGARYPSMLLVTGDGDTRVDPLHSRKMVAALQAVATTRILLRFDRDTGHGGESSVEKDMADLTEEMLLLNAELCAGVPTGCLSAATPER